MIKKTTTLRLALGLLYLLSVTVDLYAQDSPSGQITGVVYGSESPLDGASVFLIRDLSTQEIVAQTVSDEQGHFALTSPEGEYTLGVSYVGYALYMRSGVQITSGTTDIGTISLTEEATELQTVVVQGTPVRVRLQPDGYSVDVRELRERAGDALDLMKLIPRLRVKKEQLTVIGKERVIVKIGNVLQRVPSSELGSVLHGYDARLVDRVEVITQPPLRYDPEGNTAMIILHTTSAFKEYFGGLLGTEEMWGGTSNYRYGGYGSLLYNHKGVFASLAPSINWNGSKYEESQQYQRDDFLYRVSTYSPGRNDYRGLRGSLQYEYGEEKLIGLALSAGRRSYDNQFDSKEAVEVSGQPSIITNNKNKYLAQRPSLTATAYWESCFGPHNNKVWTELSYVSLTNRSQTDYSGTREHATAPFLIYSELNDLNTSGINLNHDYAIYLDADHEKVIEVGIKGNRTTTKNYRSYDEEISERPTAIRQSNRIEWTEYVLSPYVSSTLRLDSKWWMRLGLTYTGVHSTLKQIEGSTDGASDLRRYSDAWLPTAIVSYTPGPGQQFTLSLLSDIKQPRFEDLNPFVWQINERSFHRGNPSLRPETSYTAGLGYSYQGLYVKGKVTGSRGIISPISLLEGDKVYTQKENAQSGLFAGAEAGYYFDKLSWLNISLDGFYGWSRYRSRAAGLLPEAKGQEWGLSGFLDFTFNKSRTWTGYISGEYTGRKVTTVSTVEPQYSLDLGSSLYLLDKRLTLSASLLHALSSRYRGEGYREGHRITFDNRYDYPTLYLSVSYKLYNARDKSSARSQRATREIERRF